MNTFFKGIHLTIDGWRPTCNQEGWKEATNHTNRVLKTIQYNLAPKNYPTTVKTVPRLLSDLKALEQLTESRTDPVIIVRWNKMLVVRYDFGDASGDGFGSSFTSAEDVNIRIGIWNEAVSDNSSNFRELVNFVIRLEDDTENGKLYGAEIFIFTDNSTATATFHNGTSSSKTLFELVA